LDADRHGKPLIGAIDRLFGSCPAVRIRAAAIWLLVLILGCATPSERPKAIRLDQMQGWSVELAQSARPALLSGCAYLASLPGEQVLPPGEPDVRVEDWREACARIEQAGNNDPSQFSAAIGGELVVLAPRGEASPALITGYYEPEFQGSRIADARFRWPLLRLPANPERFERAEIARGALAGQGLEILYLTDAFDAYVMQVQGSGRVRLQDGEIVRLGYAGNNGRDYVAIGKLLVEAGLIDKDKVSMQAIRAYLAQHPDSVQDWLDRNPRYVFFREYDGPGPIGAAGVPLAPLASVAVDPGFLALGQPIWLNAAWPADGGAGKKGEPLAILAVALDKGGAIKGPGRIDLFWGAGPVAEEMAGRMRIEGSYYNIAPSGWAARAGWMTAP
jgi:membrane-bound lytic murein transglycosylase A